MTVYPDAPLGEWVSALWDLMETPHLEPGSTQGSLITTWPEGYELKAVRSAIRREAHKRGHRYFSHADEADRYISITCMDLYNSRPQWLIDATHQRARGAVDRAFR